MKTTILLLLLFLFFVVDLVLRSKYPQVIRPFALIYNVIYTGLVAAYSAYLIYRCTIAADPGGVFRCSAGCHGILHLEELAAGPTVTVS